MDHDRIDLHILDLIQRDATLPLGRIAHEVGLSQTPCWKRIKKLEQSGTIRRRVGILDPDALGLKLTAFLVIEALDRTREWRAAFYEAISAVPAVMEVHRLSGHRDFIVKVVVTDSQALDALVEGLTDRVAIRSCETLLSAERWFETTAIPTIREVGGTAVQDRMRSAKQ